MFPDVTPGEGQPRPNPSHGSGAVPGAPRGESEGTDRERNVDPDLSSAARALAAFVASERRPIGVEHPRDDQGYGDQGYGDQDYGDQDPDHGDREFREPRDADLEGDDLAEGDPLEGEREDADRRELGEDLDRQDPGPGEGAQAEPGEVRPRDPGPYGAGPLGGDPYAADRPYGPDEGFSQPYAHEFGPAGASSAETAPRGVPPRGLSPRGAAPRAAAPRSAAGDLFASGGGGEGHEAAPLSDHDDVPDEPRTHLAHVEATFGGTPAARVALVTGAGRGIGRAIAVGLGRAGLSVALLGRSPEALEDVAAEIASYGVGAAWAGADVRDYAQVHNAVERLEAALGEIDLLVNNAGVIEPVEVPVWEAGPETWWHVVETDLRGPFHCVRAVVPGMVERGGGRVVNLNSGVGADDHDVYSAYAAAKAGLFRITGSLHLAGYRRGVRAFEISPGVVRTEMTATMAVHAGRQDWTPVEAIVDLVTAVAAGRLDAWSGGFLRAGVDTVESLDAAELKAGEDGLPPTARRLGILPYDANDPLAPPGDLRFGRDR